MDQVLRKYTNPGVAESFSPLSAIKKRGEKYTGKWGSRDLEGKFPRNLESNESSGKTVSTLGKKKNKGRKDKDWLDDYSQRAGDGGRELRPVIFQQRSNKVEFPEEEQKKYSNLMTEGGITEKIRRRGLPRSAGRGRS